MDDGRAGEEATSALALAGRFEAHVYRQLPSPDCGGRSVRTTDFPGRDRRTSILNGEYAAFTSVHIDGGGDDDDDGVTFRYPDAVPADPGGPIPYALRTQRPSFTVGSARRLPRGDITMVRPLSVEREVSVTDYIYIYVYLSKYVLYKPAQNKKFYKSNSRKIVFY